MSFAKVFQNITPFQLSGRKPKHVTHSRSRRKQWVLVWSCMLKKSGNWQKKSGIFVQTWNIKVVFWEKWNIFWSRGRFGEFIMSKIKQPIARFLFDRCQMMIEHWKWTYVGAFWKDKTFLCLRAIFETSWCNFFCFCFQDYLLSVRCRTMRTSTREWVRTATGWPEVVQRSPFAAMSSPCEKFGGESCVYFWHIK